MLKRVHTFAASPNKLHHHLYQRSTLTSTSSLPEEKDVRTLRRNCLFVSRQQFDVDILAWSVGARVDAGRVDVCIDGAEHSADDGQDEYDGCPLQSILPMTPVGRHQRQGRAVAANCCRYDGGAVIIVLLLRRHLVVKMGRMRGVAHYVTFSRGSNYLAMR